LLDLEFLGLLKVLLVSDKLLNGPFVFAIFVDLGLECALRILLVHESGSGPLLERLDGWLVRDRAALGGAEGV
jgi:hypothetical protein